MSCGMFHIRFDIWCWEINVGPRVGGGDVVSPWWQILCQHSTIRAWGGGRAGRVSYLCNKEMSTLGYQAFQPPFRFFESVGIFLFFPFLIHQMYHENIIRICCVTIWILRIYASALNPLNFLSIWETLHCFFFTLRISVRRLYSLLTQGLWMYRPLWFAFLDQSYWPRSSKN